MSGQYMMMADMPLDFGYFELLVNGIYLEKINSRLRKDLCKFEVDQEGIYLIYKKSPKFQPTKLENFESRRSILISNIVEIRKGAQSDRFSEYFQRIKKKPEEECCICLVLRDGVKRIIDLKANSEDVRNAFYDSLCYLKDRRDSYNFHEQRNLMYKEIFIKADVNGDSVLSVKEIVDLLLSLNIKVTEFYVIFLIKKEQLNLDEFIELIKLLQARIPINRLFKRYSSNGCFLTAEELKRLLEQEQDENISMEECCKLIELVETSSEFIAQRYLSEEGFYKTFLTEYFSLMDSKCEEVYQDMNQPITHYFIDSSHNTYLEGDQFNSNSKIECYVKALKSGCRCVEIDVWDGSPDPIVCHGYANTTKLQFAEVIEAIDIYAFESSKYPVILSIENHCSVEQQKRMAKIMIDRFGDKLLTKLDNESRCPTPGELENKIIVKCKKADFTVSDKPNMSQVLSEEEETKKMAKELSDLVVLCQAAKFSNFKHSSQNHNFKHIISFEESRAKEFSEQDMKGFIVHNMKVLSRIYPAGTRLKSSNYDPMPLWLAGCQIVALNYQTPTEPMFLNKGMFSDNGGCGYLLKPEFLRCVDKVEDFGIGPCLLTKPKQLFVTIIDGFALPKKPNHTEDSILDPFVQVKIIGIPMDCACHRTKVIKKNGFNPFWEQQFSFSILCPEMALIVFEVHDYESMTRDVLVAQTCQRVATMKTGYRFLQLNDTFGQALLSNLIVHITI